MEKQLYIGVSNGIFPFTKDIELTGDEFSTLLSFVSPDRIHVSETSTCQPGQEWKQETCDFMIVPGQDFISSETPASLKTIPARRFFDEYLTKKEQQKLVNLVHDRLRPDSGWNLLQMFQGMPIVLIEQDKGTDRQHKEIILTKPILRNRMIWTAIDQNNASFLAELYDDEIPFNELLRKWITLEAHSESSIVPIGFSKEGIERSHENMRFIQHYYKGPT